MFIRAFVLLALLAVVPRLAHADTDGTYGTVGHIRVNLPGSDTYGYYRGFVQIAGVNYFWGGAYCPGITPPTDGQLTLLMTARVEGISVNPYYKTPYSPSYYCLSNFETY